MESFPESPCYICAKPIENLDGSVLADRFIGHLEEIVRMEGSPQGAVSGANGNLVKAITSNYFEQFYDMFHKNDDDVIEFSTMMKDMLVDSNAHVYRLNAVLEEGRKDNTKGYESYLQLFLLGHDSCLPQGQYEIPLNRINTHEQGVEWTIHLSEKVWWNPHGWARMLEHLYGRIDT